MDDNLAPISSHTDLFQVAIDGCSENQVYQEEYEMDNEIIASALEMCPLPRDVSQISVLWPIYNAASPIH